MAGADVLTAAGAAMAFRFLHFSLKAPSPSPASPIVTSFSATPSPAVLQTYEGLIQAFEPHQLIGVQEEVQLREQDFGNFQVGGLRWSVVGLPRGGDLSRKSVILCWLGRGAFREG